MRRYRSFLGRPLPRLAGCRSGDCATLVSSTEKSNLRLTAGCEDARSSRSGERRACDMGATDDCLLGDEPMFVLYGDRPEGGGNMEFVDLRIRRVERTSIGSGTEPGGGVSTDYAR